MIPGLDGYPNPPTTGHLNAVAWYDISLLLSSELVISFECLPICVRLSPFAKCDIKLSHSINGNFKTHSIAIGNEGLVKDEVVSAEAQQMTNYALT